MKHQATPLYFSNNWVVILLHHISYAVVIR